MTFASGFVLFIYFFFAEFNLASDTFQTYYTRAQYGVRMNDLTVGTTG